MYFLPSELSLEIKHNPPPFHSLNPFKVLKEKHVYFRQTVLCWPIACLCTEMQQCSVAFLRLGTVTSLPLRKTHLFCSRSSWGTHSSTIPQVCMVPRSSHVLRPLGCPRVNSLSVHEFHVLWKGGFALLMLLSPIQVHIGYLPNKQVLGLSKLAR